MKYRLWILLIALGQNVFGQDEDHAEHDHGHHHEIGIANAPVYFIKEKELSYGLHFHYLANFHFFHLFLYFALSNYQTNKNFVEYIQSFFGRI